jgi:hypothetical protein
VFEVLISREFSIQTIATEPIRWVQGKKILRRIGDAFSGRVYQSLAILFCVLFGIAMIANTQMSGEAWWFWYANLFHNGSKLYANLHLPLQPLFVLETNAWIQSFGIKCLVTEIPSVILVAIFSLGIFLILRESDWPDWQKAIVLASAFLITVYCVVYRFDDYHILADTLIYYSLALLLLLAKADEERRQFGLAAGLGVLSGMAVTTRLNDGVALLVATGVCLLFLVRKRKLIVASLFVAVAAVTVGIVVKLTGDSLSDYVSNSIIKAAGAKGGAVSIFAAPIQLFLTAFHGIRGHRWLFPWLVAVVAAGAVVQHYCKNKFKYLVVLQLGMAGVALALSSPYNLQQLLSIVTFVSLVVILVNYLLVPVVAARFFISKIGDGKPEWDSREILILIPLAELASFSTSNAGTVASFLSPIALFLILVPVIQPFRRQASWANATLVTIMALMGLRAMTDKIIDPYTWLLFHSSPMFENRQWYQHPVYGAMYIERDLLQFIEPVCKEIERGNPKPELLSMPFSYPNYFCNTPPWHGYVQTFYDTSTRSTIEKLIGELQTAPPQWIVYQRQIKVLTLQEKTYHKGQPLAHRDLDTLIMQKIAMGQWQLVEKGNYLLSSSLPPDKTPYQEGDGWYVIRTRP